MILTAFNPSTSNLEKSHLTSSYAAGVTSLVLRNNDRFSEDDFILIGEMGSENAEIAQVTAAVSGATDITVTATTLPHSASDPVYVLRYNQIKFYRSTTTIDGSYSNIATLDIDVDNHDKKTLFDDTTGLTSYFYKVSFYNSETAVESSLSDPMTGTGYSRKQVGSLINDFLTEIGDLEQEYITVPQIISLLNECSEDIIGQSRRPIRLLRKSENATITAGDDRVPLPDDLVRLDRVKHTYSDGIREVVANVPVITIEEMEYMKYDEDSITTPVATGIRHVAVDDTTNELVIHPTPTSTQADKIQFYYWSNFDTITSLADEFQVPVSRIYKMFLLGRYFRMRAKKDDGFLALSDRYLNDYSTEVVKLQRAQKVDIGTPMSFLPDTRTRRGLRRPT